MAKDAFLQRVSSAAQSLKTRVGQGVDRVIRAARTGVAFIAKKGRELSKAAWRSAWASFLDWDFSNLPAVPCTSLTANESPDWVPDEACKSRDTCPFHPG
eukprot:844521-Amphidinium_carterae.1